MNAAQFMFFTTLDSSTKVTKFVNCRSRKCLMFPVDAPQVTRITRIVTNGLFVAYQFFC